jgi:uncharacterized protein (TIGR00369 family)
VPEPVNAPFTAFIGGEIEEKSEGFVRLSLVTGPQHADAIGNVHTGALTTLMDSVIGIALGTLRGERGTYRPHATIEMSTSFYAHASPGDEIDAEGRITQLSERVAFGEVEAHRRSDGLLLAKARLTFAIPAARP